MRILLTTSLSRLAFLSTVLLGLGAAPAFGQESDGAKSLVLEEIVVTAQKRDQSLQDIAAAVTNLSCDELDVLNIVDAFDLSDKVPGLVMNNVQGYRRTISMRGIGNELPDNAATKPGVAYHIDGVFMSNDFALFQDLAYQDSDYEYLYELSLDGIEDSPVGVEHGISNLHFDEWFIPFDNAQTPVHPYCD